MLEHIMQTKWKEYPGIRGLPDNNDVANRKKLFQPMWNETWNRAGLDDPAQPTSTSNNGHQSKDPGQKNICAVT